jgi:hypothetical protein
MEKRKKAVGRIARKVHASVTFLDMYTLSFLPASKSRNISETSSEPASEQKNPPKTSLPLMLSETQVPAWEELTNAQLLSMMNPLLGSSPMRQQQKIRYHDPAAVYALSSAQANPLRPVTFNQQLDPALRRMAASTQLPPGYRYTSSNHQVLALNQLILGAPWMQGQQQGPMTYVPVKSLPGSQRNLGNGLYPF